MNTPTMRTASTCAGAAIVALAVLLGPAACDNDPAGPNVSRSWNYDLVSVDGESLPVIVAEAEGCRHRVDGAVLMLDSRGFFDMTMDWREQCGTIGGPGEQLTVWVTGDWDLEESRLDLVTRRPGEVLTIVGTMQGGAVTMELGAFSLPLPGTGLLRFEGDSL